MRSTSLILRYIATPRLTSPEYFYRSLTKTHPAAIASSTITNTFKKLNIQTTLPVSFTTIQKRSITCVAELKNTYSFLQEYNKHLSPLHGAILAFSGTLERLYDLAPHLASATSDLVKNFFYKQGDQFYPSALKSNPVHSLTPLLIARILHYLTLGTLDKAQNEIRILWSKEHLKLTGSRLSLSKVNFIFKILIQSHKECVDKKYPLHTTETILLSFLYLKATTREDILCYLSELQKLNPQLSQKKLPLISSEYSEQEIKESKDQISTATKKLSGVSLKSFIEDNYELLLCTIMLTNNKLIEVRKSNYGYKGAIPRPNCVESSFHNLCNIILYNPKKNKFDFQQLPNTLNPHPKIKEFYAMQEYKTSFLNSKKIGQAFIDMVSGHSFLSYISSSYELDATIDNFISLMNYFFGCTATSVEEFSLKFSNTQRKFVFQHTKDGINIIIRDKYSEPDSLIFSLNPGKHGELRATYFQEKKEHQDSFVYTQLSKLASVEAEKNLMLLSALQKINNEQALYSNDSFFFQQSRYLFLSQLPKFPFETFELIKKAVLNINADSNLENYILHLCAKFENDDSFISKILVLFITHRLDITNKNINDFCRKYLLSYLWHKSILISPEKLLEEESIILSSLKGKDILKDPEQLILALEKCPLFVSKILIGAGADPNAPSKAGIYPLHCATNSSAIKLLLDAGANPNIKNPFGQSLLDTVTNTESVKLLLNAGAKSKDDENRICISKTFSQNKF